MATTPKDVGTTGRRARRLRRKNKRGVALIMVLGAITVLTVFLTELQEETTAELSAALAERDALKAEYHARSAVNLSRLLIATEPTIRRALAPILMMLKIEQVPVWLFSDMVLGPFNDEAGVAAFGGLAGLDTSTGKNLGLSGGRFEVKIVDEDSKVNVNVAANPIPTQRDRLAAQILSLFAPVENNPLFEGRDGDDQFSDRATICGALVDWADPNEDLYPCNLTANAPSSAGGEDNFYQTIGLDYRRKNAPYDSLQELRLVRGMSDDVWATFVDPDPNDPTKRLMTVWGQDKVNINGANAQTLLALVCSAAADGTELCNDVVQMQSFLAGMSLAKSLTMGVSPFAKPSDFVKAMEGKNAMISPLFETLGIKPVVFTNRKGLLDSLTNKSKVFSIYAEGVVPGNRRTTRVRVHAVVDTRSAVELGAPLQGLGGTAGGAQASNRPGQPAATGNTQNPADLTPEAIAAALKANPAGTIVYWRVE